MVLVYDSKAQEFTNDGLGAITPSSCVVTEEINGPFELELSHPIDSFGKWKRLQKNNIIRVNAHRGVQAFLGNTDQAFISRWGGEIVRDNFSIAINTRLSRDSPE